MGLRAAASEASSGHQSQDPVKMGLNNVHYRQVPIAVVGMANRLPSDSNNPSTLWDFLEHGGVANNDPPKSRFSLKGHLTNPESPIP